MSVRRFRILIFALALLSVGLGWSYDHPDEHYQLLEFLSGKFLGTPLQDLPWEFSRQMRPSLQIYLYEFLRRLAVLGGLTSAFNWTLCIRVFSACLGLFVLDRYYHRLLQRAAPIEARFEHFFYGLGAAALFLPSLLIRPSSEGLGISLFLWGCALDLTPEPHGLRKTFGVGLLWGLAFQVKYLLALWILPMLLFRFYRKRSLGSQFFAGAVGFGLANVFGIMMDSFFYGTWTLAPWNYLKANLLESAASAYGVWPWWGYLTNGVQQSYGLLLLGGLFLCVWCWRRSEGAFAVVFSSVILSLIPHKELRFLFPSLPLMMGVVAECLHEKTANQERWLPWAQKILKWALPLLLLFPVYELSVRAFSLLSLRAWLHYSTEDSEPLYTTMINPYPGTDLKLHFYDHGSRPLTFAKTVMAPGLWIFDETTLEQSEQQRLERCGCAEILKALRQAGQLFPGVVKYPVWRCPTISWSEQCRL